MNMYGFVGNDGINFIDYLGNFIVGNINCHERYDNVESCSTCCDLKLADGLTTCSAIMSGMLRGCVMIPHPALVGVCVFGAIAADVACISHRLNEHNDCLEACCAESLENCNGQLRRDVVWRDLMFNEAILRCEWLPDENKIECLNSVKSSLEVATRRIVDDFENCIQQSTQRVQR